MDMMFKNVQEQRELSLSERVARQISDLIKERNLSAGDKLPNEFELGESLNVGRGTIREAVKLLVARNCLEIRRGKGTFVTEELGKVNDPFGFEFVLAEGTEDSVFDSISEEEKAILAIVEKVDENQLIIKLSFLFSGN